MQTNFFAAVIASLLLSGCAQEEPPAVEFTEKEAQFWDDGSTVQFAAEDPFAEEVLSILKEARQDVEAFWNEPFAEPVNAILSPDRRHFDKAFPPEWGIGKTRCWMVGVGVADFLAVLSPAVWSEENCNHDGNDSQHVRDIFVHELAHVYHGQRNPTRDFSGAEEIGWFAEGLSVLIAGQLNRDRTSSPVEAINNGAAPKSLKKVWSGQYRYGVAGSIVAYIDAEYGRDALWDLLSVVSEEQLLTRLNTDEQSLIESWRKWVLENATE